MANVTQKFLDLNGLSTFLAQLDTRFAKPSDIPTVNNATLTIQQNTTQLGTFTANASTNVTVNVETPQVQRFI